MTRACLPRAFRPSFGRCWGQPAAGLDVAADLIRIVLAGAALAGTALDGPARTGTALTGSALDGTALHGTVAAFCPDLPPRRRLPRPEHPPTPPTARARARCAHTYAARVTLFGPRTSDPGIPQVGSQIPQHLRSTGSMSLMNCS